MTREEAIRCIQVWRTCHTCPSSKDCYDEKTNTLCELYHDMDRLDFGEALDMAIEALKEPKQGEWIKNQNTFWTCTNCEWVNKHNRDLYNFCPNCGARMKEGDEK